MAGGLQSQGRLLPPCAPHGNAPLLTPEQGDGNGGMAGAPSPPPVGGHAPAPCACSWKRSNSTYDRGGRLNWALEIRAVLVMQGLESEIVFSPHSAFNAGD
jgi:hypothetical protein